MSYPEGFFEWSLDRRNDFFAAEANRYDERKRPANGHALAENSVEPPRPLTRDLPPADPFPVSALGDVLSSAAMAIHDRVQAPVAIGGQSVLAAAALSVQAHADVELPTGQRRRSPCFWSASARAARERAPATAKRCGLFGREKQRFELSTKTTI